jgi:hypothetical protein
MALPLLHILSSDTCHEPSSSPYSVTARSVRQLTSNNPHRGATSISDGCVQDRRTICLLSRNVSLQPRAHAGSSLADFSILKMEAIRSSETSVQFTRSTRRHIPEDGILLVFLLHRLIYLPNSTTLKCLSATRNNYILHQEYPRRETNRTSLSCKIPHPTSVSSKLQFGNAVCCKSGQP